MNEVVKNAALNIGAGVASSIVFVYLEREGFTRPAYIVFAAYLAAVGLVFVRAVRSRPPAISAKSHPQAQVDNDVDLDPNEKKGGIFHSILILVAKYHSQNIEATPARIAADLSLDPEVTLAYMWKYHNEQFITFPNGGKKPDLNTPFFLSPNAWQHIKVVRA